MSDPQEFLWSHNLRLDCRSAVIKQAEVTRIADANSESAVCLLYYSKCVPFPGGMMVEMLQRSPAERDLIVINDRASPLQVVSGSPPLYLGPQDKNPQGEVSVHFGQDIPSAII